MDTTRRALWRGAYCLNLLDAGLTLGALRLGAVEGNPLMAWPPLMLAYKLILAALLLRWLARRPEPLAQSGLRLCCGLYGALDLYHLAARLALALAG